MSRCVRDTPTARLPPQPPSHGAALHALRREHCGESECLEARPVRRRRATPLPLLLLDARQVPADRPAVATSRQSLIHSRSEGEVTADGSCREVPRPQ